MAGSLAGIRFSTILRSTRSLSKTMRRHLKEVADGDTEFKNEIKPALETARQRGDVDKIYNLVEQYHKKLHEKGELLLEDDEEKEVGAEIKFLHMLDDIPAELHALKQRVASSDLEAEGRGQLNKAINECKTLLKKMADAMFDSIKQQYTSVFAEAKVAEGEDEHSVVAEGSTLLSSHIVNLAEAAKHIYKLRSDKRTVKSDVSAVDELLDILDEEVAKITKNHNMMGKLQRKIHAQEEDLVRNVKALLQHITTTFHRFTLIMQVFTSYYFMLQRDDKHMNRFLETLHEENFPAHVLDEMTGLMAKDKKHSEDEVHNLQNALARLRRPVQEFEVKLKAA